MASFSVIPSGKARQIRRGFVILAGIFEGPEGAKTGGGSPRFAHQLQTDFFCCGINAPIHGLHIRLNTCSAADLHPPGLEPGTKRLRVFCSTIELEVHDEKHWPWRLNTVPMVNRVAQSSKKTVRRQAGKNSKSEGSKFSKMREIYDSLSRCAVVGLSRPMKAISHRNTKSLRPAPKTHPLLITPGFGGEIRRLTSLASGVKFL
jgi:hypothetical protein